jgi:putative hemolysin
VYKTEVLHRLVQEARKTGDEGTFQSRLIHALNTGLDISASGLARVPGSGAAVVVANHPFGGTLEGLLISTFLRRRRPDVRAMIGGLPWTVPELEHECFVLRRHLSPGSREHNTEATMLAADFLRSGGVLVVFPGALNATGWADRGDDDSWNPVAVSFALQADACVIPAYIDGAGRRASGWLAHLHPVLSELSLARQIVGLRHRTLRARIGESIAASQVRALGPARSAVESLRQHTFALAADGDGGLERPAP